MPKRTVIVKGLERDRRLSDILRGARQPNRPRRVLAPPRRRTQPQGHEQDSASPLALLQQPQAAPLPGDANARGTGYPSGHSRL